MLAKQAALAASRWSAWRPASAGYTARTSPRGPAPGAEGQALIAGWREVLPDLSQKLQRKPRQWLRESARKTWHQDVCGAR